MTPYQRKVLSLFRDLKRCERQVVFVVGNRDYLVKEAQLGETFTQVIEHEATVEIAKKKTLLLHGDRINPDDRLYALWHRLSRNGLSNLLVQSMPAGLAQRLSQNLEEKLAKTNQSYKSGSLPMQHLENLSRRAAQAGAEQVIVGHFHADTIVQGKDGVPVIIAPAWLDQRKILVIDDDSDEIRSENPLVLC